MPLYIDGKKSRSPLKCTQQASKLLAALKLGRESVIVKCNGKIITEFDKVSPKDLVEIVMFSSRG